MDGNIVCAWLIYFKHRVQTNVIYQKSMKKNCVAHIEKNDDGLYLVHSEEEFPFSFCGQGHTINEAVM